MRLVNTRGAGCAPSWNKQQLFVQFNKRRSIKQWNPIGQCQSAAISLVLIDKSLHQDTAPRRLKHASFRRFDVLMNSGPTKKFRVNLNAFKITRKVLPTDLTSFSLITNKHSMIITIDWETIRKLWWCGNPFSPRGAVGVSKGGETCWIKAERWVCGVCQLLQTTATTRRSKPTPIQ